MNAMKAALTARRGRNGQDKNAIPFPVGSKIRPIANFGRHGYQSGKTYTVTKVDSNDHTLCASDASGGEGNWIRWADCQLSDAIGWEWLKGVLPAEALDLLSNFDGLQHLSLKEEVRNKLLLKIPNLKSAIVEAQLELQTKQQEMEEATIAAGDGDDDDDLSAFLPELD